MTPVRPRHPAGLVRWLLLLAVSALAACATPQATRISDELPFEQAVAQATDGLVAQTRKLPAFLAKVETTLARRGVVLDPMIDAASGQQTAATQALQELVTRHMADKYQEIEILPFQSAHLAKAQYLLTGTMTRDPASRRALRISLALTDLRAGTVVAQASAIARDQNLDHTPLAYYRDSPVVLARDRVIEGYVTTTAAAPGSKADAVYLERIATATLINEATTLYNAERYQDALGQYRNALATPAGEQLRVLNGIYLSNVKLGRVAEAEEAFAKVVAMGIAYNALGVKFLFNPGSTEFWSDPRISSVYGMWMRQIAREATRAKVCMDVVGHTSATGSEQVNDALSLQRAAVLRQKLIGESAELAGRTRAVGMGMRENIVGTGTDNAVDALDRRVEFKIRPCS